MKVYSSYYDKTRELNEDEYVLLRVSRKEPPEWFMDTVPNHVDLSDMFGPTEAMLKECPPNENWAEFKPRYKKDVLGKLDKISTLDSLNRIFLENDKRPLLLLCYETPDLMCHRHLIADYLGIEITELN